MLDQLLPFDGRTTYSLGDLLMFSFGEYINDSMKVLWKSILNSSLIFQFYTKQPYKKGIIYILKENIKILNISTKIIQHALYKDKGVKINMKNK